jgi:hypothetical protein
LRAFFKNAGLFAPIANPLSMPDLASILVRSSIGALLPSGAECGDCRRTPLAGERMHEVHGGRTLCDLCFASLPEESRVAVRTERVHVSERRLAVVPRAA